MMLGTLVRMDLPSQPHYGMVGVLVGYNQPQENQDDVPLSIRNRITYNILVNGVVLKDQLYEYFVEVDGRFEVGEPW